MPPLNIQGFKKFDEWQIDVIHKINKGESIFTIAPTSAGKTVLAGYAVTKGRVLFLVPTDALAWQVSSYLGGILNKNIPILTQTYQTHPARKEMIKILNNSEAIVGTPETLVDFLPFMRIDFDRIILDEIHMIGKPEGSAMEYIIKVIHNVPILALSATVGNPDELVLWLKNISPSIPISIVSCTKRFFNLQRYVYDNNQNELI
jgi:superfamily II RNA helicase